MIKALPLLLAGTIMVTTTACSAQPARASQPQVKEAAQVPTPGGQERIELFKDRKKLETVTCRDFNMVDESFRPQAVVYAAKYGPKGKPDPTMTVDGVESIVPVVIDSCKARPGDHFATAVHAAMKMQR